MNINVPASQIAIQQFLNARDNGEVNQRLMIDGNTLVCRNYHDISIFTRIAAKLFGRGAASFKNVMSFASQCSLDTKTVQRLNSSVSSYNREHLAFKRVLGLTMSLIQPASSSPILEKMKASVAGPTLVEVNREVLEKKCSDHSIVTFHTTDGPIISSNVMCSGEDHDLKDANSFGIDPTARIGQKRRFEDMVEALRRTAELAYESQGKLPIIALQEFPRVKATGYEAFIELIKTHFPDYTLCFGKVEHGHHISSQLCMLVPKNVEKAEIPRFSELEARIQVVVLGEVAYINIHPSPNLHAEVDFLQNNLQIVCRDLFAMNGELKNIHIVGDWNRKKEELERWQVVDSANKESHYPKVKYMPPNVPSLVWPRPIDHHVFVQR